MHDRHRTDRMPDFVVIGAQKSASTFLQDQMAQHPSIEIAEGETRAFEDPFYSLEAVDAIPSLFHDTAAGVVRGIKRPDYLARNEVAERLHDHLPHARLLVVIREPVARAVSAYFHYVRHGFIPLAPLDEAFETILTGGWVDRYPRSAEILDYGRYGHHLRRWLQLFPRDHLMVFEQKSLVSAPAPALRAAFEFLGVDPEFVPDTTASVSNKGVYSPARLRLLRTKNRFVYDYSPELDIRRPRKKSPFGWLYNAAVVGVDRTVLSRFDDGRPPQLDPDLRRRVADYYEDDRLVLREILEGTGVGAPWL